MFFFFLSDNQKLLTFLKIIQNKAKDKYKAKCGKSLKTPTPKEMLLRLLIALAQVKAVNTSGNLLCEIRQIIYFL